MHPEECLKDEEESEDDFDYEEDKPEGIARKEAERLATQWAPDQDE
jgi:hypothetical protein